jgi:tetratricopeptide (TPR) repeat protein
MSILPILNRTDGSLLLATSMLRVLQRSSRHLLSVAVAASLAIMLACSQNPESAKRKYAESGDRYAAAGKTAEAVLEYRNALKIDARAGEVRRKLAELLLKRGELPAALGEYVRAADLLPGDRSVQLKAGNLLLVAGRFDDAKARAEKILEQAPRDLEAQTLLANSYAGLKNLDAAVSQIEEALKIAPDRSGSYSNLGALELSRGKQDAAEAAFLKAVHLAPNSAPAHLALGTFYWLTTRTAAAEASFKKALEVAPRDPLTNRVIASFYLASSRREDAEAHLRTVYEVTKTPAAAFALADYYAAAGNNAGAKAVLEPLLNDPRAATTASVGLASLDFRIGNHDQAYRRLTGVLAKDPNNLQAMLVKTALLMADQKSDEALLVAAAAAEHHPESTPALFMLGRVQAVRKQPDGAIAAFQEVLRLNPRASEAKVALANLHLAQGKPETSIGFAQEVLANEPANADAQLVFVRGLLMNGQVERAEPELKRLVARYPNSASVRTQMGVFYGRKRDFKAARGEFERALTIDHGAVDALGGLVAIDLSAHDFASARARVDEHVATKPTAPLLALAARTYAAFGDRAAAERFLRQSIDIDPMYFPSYEALGQLYIVQGKLDAALAEFDAFAKRSPKSIGALTMAGMIVLTKGDIAGARSRFERVMQIDPEAAVAANNLAWIYAENEGNLDVALNLAQTAQRRLPDVAAVNDTLGFIYYKKNLPGLAISTLKVGAEKDPGNAQVRYHLGLAYASAGETAQAKHSLGRALALRLGADDARRAGEMLKSLDLR